MRIHISQVIVAAAIGLYRGPRQAEFRHTVCRAVSDEPKSLVRARSARFKEMAVDAQWVRDTAANSPWVSPF